MDKTDNEMIFIERDMPLSEEAVEEKLELLRHAIEQSQRTGKQDIVRQALMQAVPAFHPAAEMNPTDCVIPE